jgi:hypothetical protein
LRRACRSLRYSTRRAEAGADEGAYLIHPRRQEVVVLFALRDLPARMIAYSFLRAFVSIAAHGKSIVKLEVPEYCDGREEPIRMASFRIDFVG